MLYAKRVARFLASRRAEYLTSKVELDPIVYLTQRLRVEDLQPYRQIITSVCEAFPECDIVAVGNSVLPPNHKEWKRRKKLMDKFPHSKPIPLDYGTVLHALITNLSTADFDTIQQALATALTFPHKMTPYTLTSVSYEQGTVGIQGKNPNAVVQFANYSSDIFSAEINMGTGTDFYLCLGQRESTEHFEPYGTTREETEKLGLRGAYFSIVSSPLKQDTNLQKLF